MGENRSGIALPALGGARGLALAYVVAFFGWALATIGDLVTGVDVAFTLLYLGPIGVAVWYGSRAGGVAISVLSAMGSFSIRSPELRSGVTSGVAVWNVVGELGVFLVVTYTLDALRRRFDEQSRLLIEARAAQADAEAARIAREQVLAIVAHDMGSPLTAIAWQAQELRDWAHSERQPSVETPACRILRATDEMASLIADHLDIARLDAGGFHLACALEDVSEIVEAVHEQVQPTATSRGITVERTIEGPTHAWCDGRRLARVLANLVGNGLRFTHRGGAVSISLVGTDDELRCAVSDSGPGVPEGDRDQVFARYWKGKDSQGTGLGLFIAREIIAAHGGRLWLETPDGGGARFIFTLPRSRPAAAEA